MVPFLALVVLSPLPLGGYRALPWSLNAIAAAALLIAWGVLSLRSGSRPPMGLARLALPLVLALALVAWMTVQALGAVPHPWSAPLWGEVAPLLGGAVPAAPVSVNPEAGMVMALRFLTHGAIFFLAVQFGRSRRRAERIYTVLAYAGLCYAAYGLAMHLGGFNRVLWWERWAYTDSVTSTFVNRNHFATFAGLSLVCAFALLGRSLLHRGAAGGIREWLMLLADLMERRLLLVLTVMVLFSAVILSHSRGGLAATLAGLAVLGAVLGGSKRLEGGARRSLTVIGAFLLVPLILMMGGETLFRFGDWNFGSDARTELFRLTLQAIADAPWLGHGGGSFADVIQLYLDRSLPESVRWAHAHNSYLEFALELGLPALLGLLALIGWLVGQCVAGLSRRRRDRIYPAVGIAATVVVGLHALVDFSIQLPGVVIPYLTLLGVAYAQSWPFRRRAR
ncbi:O-antigen ligase family protein [Endothiovibrio diazotrophicus]